MCLIFFFCLPLFFFFYLLNAGVGIGTNTQSIPVGFVNALNWTEWEEIKRNVASALHRDSSHVTLNTELDSKEHQNASKSMKHLQLSHIIMLPSNSATAADRSCADEKQGKIPVKLDSHKQWRFLSKAAEMFLYSTFTPRSEAKLCK